MLPACLDIGVPCPAWRKPRTTVSESSGTSSQGDPPKAFSLGHLAKLTFRQDQYSEGRLLPHPPGGVLGVVELVALDGGAHGILITSGYHALSSLSGS